MRESAQRRLTFARKPIIAINMGSKLRPEHVEAAEDANPLAASFILADWSGLMMSKRIPEYDPAIKRTRTENNQTAGMLGTPKKHAGGYFLREALECYSVYFVRADKHVKIGYAKTLSTRMRQIQVSSPYEVRLDGILLVNTEDSARTIEAALHKRGQEDGLRVRNEWFLLSDTDVSNMVKWAKSYYADHVFRATVVARSN